MRLLVLGGTLFLGRHIVDSAQARGHELTLFNRGRTDPPIPGVEQIHGDREHDLALLAGRSWDAVIDTSGYWPRAVRASAELLAENVDRYVFVSSISAYGRFPELGSNEDAPTAPDPPPDASDVMEHYAELKASCERVVEDVLPGRALVIRPGLIVGPLDPTERFTYWVRRLADGRPGPRASRARPAGPADRRARSRRLDRPDGRAAEPSARTTPPGRPRP